MRRLAADLQAEVDLLRADVLEYRGYLCLEILAYPVKNEAVGGEKGDMLGLFANLQWSDPGVKLLIRQCLFKFLQAV